MAAERPAKRQNKEAVRAGQKEWIEGVLKATRQSASQLAAQAGLSDTTLSRFLNNPEHAGALSTMTISQIAASTGIEPPAAFTGRAVQEGPPGFAEEATPYEVVAEDDGFTRKVLAMLAERPNAAPWLVGSDALAMEGVRRGDIVIVDMGVPPRNGDIVCAQIYEGARARTVIRLYQQPYLVGPPMGGPPVTPEPVDGRRVLVRGVMTDLLRRRR